MNFVKIVLVNAILCSGAYMKLCPIWKKFGLMLLIFVKVGATNAIHFLWVL